MALYPVYAVHEGFEGEVAVGGQAHVAAGSGLGSGLRDRLSHLGMGEEPGKMGQGGWNQGMEVEREVRQMGVGA